MTLAGFLILLLVVAGFLVWWRRRNSPRKIVDSLRHMGMSDQEIRKELQTHFPDNDDE